MWMFIIFLPHTNNISLTRPRDPCLTVEVFDSTTFQALVNVVLASLLGHSQTMMRAGEISDDYFWQ